MDFSFLPGISFFLLSQNFGSPNFSRTFGVFFFLFFFGGFVLCPVYRVSQTARSSMDGKILFRSGIEMATTS
jgi:hypothetical protein